MLHMYQCASLLFVCGAQKTFCFSLQQMHYLSNGCIEHAISQIRKQQCYSLLGTYGTNVLAIGHDEVYCKTLSAMMRYAAKTFSAMIR